MSRLVLEEHTGRATRRAADARRSADKKNDQCVEWSCLKPVEPRSVGRAASRRLADSLVNLLASQSTAY